MSIRTRVHTGGNKEFVHDESKSYGDTESTNDFKKALRKWSNKPKIFGKRRGKVKEEYSKDYKHSDSSNNKKHIKSIKIKNNKT